MFYYAKIDHTIFSKIRLSFLFSLNWLTSNHQKALLQCSIQLHRCQLSSRQFTLKAWHNFHVIVIPWLQVILLVYTPKARGPQAGGLRVYMSVKSQAAMVSTNIYYSHTACFYIRLNRGIFAVNSSSMFAWLLYRTI